MSFLEVLPLLVAWTVAVIAPGPDFLAVLRASTSGSRRRGLFAAAGVVTGMACWAMAALAGVSALLARYQQLYVIARLAGAAFLIVYGLTTLRGAWRRAPEASEAPVAPAAGSVSPGLGWRSWRLGLFTNLANPKALVFFGALFASLLPADAGMAGAGRGAGGHAGDRVRLVHRGRGAGQRAGRGGGIPPGTSDH